MDALPPLHAVLEAQREATDALQRQTSSVIPWMFRHDGVPISNLYAAWRGACQRAGLVGRIRHDFRRTAVRNLVRAGVNERRAMRLTGHKTREVFDRYDITNEADLREGVAKLASLHDARAQRKILPLRTGTE